MQTIKIHLWIVGCLLVSTLPAQSAHQLQREGDRQYEQSNFQQAEQSYRQAIDKKPGDPRLQYNTGNALYRQGNYPASAPYFDQAAKTAKDPAKQADAWHNLGNAQLMQQKYQEAVDAYENSLRARPGDPDTKVNLQFAKKKLKKQQEDQKKQEQQNQQGQADSEQKKQPSQENQGQNQPDQQQGQQPPGQPQNQQGQQNNPGQPKSQDRLSPEQARQLRETAVAPADKQNARKYREQEPGKYQVTPKKDW